MNTTVLIGRLTKDPELGYIPSGTAVCRFTLAIDKQLSRDKKMELEAKNQPTADFINILTWGKLAENCGNYLKKGSKAAVQGRIQTGSYVADDGIKKYTTEVVASQVQFLDSKGGQGTDAQTSSSQELNPPGFYPVEDDNIPF